MFWKVKTQRGKICLNFNFLGGMFWTKFQIRVFWGFWAQILPSHFLDAFASQIVSHILRMWKLTRTTNWKVLSSSGSSGRVGARNMKYLRPSLVVMFFMTYFYRFGEGFAPPPPDPLMSQGGHQCRIPWNLSAILTTFIPTPIPKHHNVFQYNSAADARCG